MNGFNIRRRNHLHRIHPALRQNGGGHPEPQKQIRKALFRHTKGCTLDASWACSGKEWGNRATFS